MKKILSILGSTLLAVPGTTSTISCGPPKKENKLENLIKVTDLGEFENFRSLIGNVDIEERLMELNEDLENWYFSLYIIDDSSAYVVPTSLSNKTGMVKVTFTIKQENEFKNYVTQTNLGNIENNEKKTIINKFKELNPQIDDLESPYITVENEFNLFEDSQTISNRGFDQPGIVSVTFTVG
ncbi:hypothetical protein SCHIN_v1c03450 [Spiroplasma chinense]|uniref:Lipoprotein n=1 Tax=Spiroplasma chinense TaxID=216932 RepID=A0A5B9Y669_9MOLU|nr:lipoprotein [Spiroplasma chinense]QEH61542.1 hypothetical protein SCHIN_v1c03450 [Spiroplasma chinense]